nr:tetratricopeptide repeat protein [Micromonospora sp. DSM 115978]
MDHSESDNRPPADRARLLSWYLHSARAAVTAMLPFSRIPPLDPPEAGVVPVAFATAAEAVAWYEREGDNLVAATRLAHDTGEHAIAWRFAAVLRGVYMHRNAFDDWLATGRIGLASARAAGDRQGEAEALESLGKAHFQARQLAEAAEHHEAALTIRREIGDELGVVVSINALGLLGLRHRRLNDSVRHFTEALDIATRLGNNWWRALLCSATSARRGTRWPSSRRRRSCSERRSASSERSVTGVRRGTPSSSSA